MASLRDQLTHALDVDPPHGVLGWMHSGPADQALKVARGQEAEALAALEAIMAEPAAPPRLRRNAVPVLTQLYLRTLAMPSAEQIYAAAQRGEPFDPQRAVRAAMQQLVTDADLEVRIAAAVELLQMANPGDLPALRGQLAALLPQLRERRGLSPQVQHALLALGGAPEVLTRLTEVAAATGPLPPDLEALLAAVERDPDPAAAPLLARMFPRLDAIAERHDPVKDTIAGEIPTWDAATIQVVMLWTLYLRLVPAASVPAAVALLRAASPAMAAVLVGELDALGDRAVALASAAAADAALAAPVRGAAVATLLRFAQQQNPTGLVAIERLQRLRGDPVVGADATRALAGVGAAKS